MYTEARQCTWLEAACRGHPTEEWKGGSKPEPCGPSEPGATGILLSRARMRQGPKDLRGSAQEGSGRGT